MARTINKGVRFTAEELGHIAQLRPQFPEYHTEADLLRHAALLGILVLAAQATRPEMLPYAGYPVDDLAALLKPRLLSAIDFLNAQDALPVFLIAQRAGTTPMMATTMIAEAIGMETLIDHAAAEELEGLGTGFMDE